MSVGLGTHIKRAARRHPAKAALIDHGRVFSYAEFDERTDRLASALLGLGVLPGERVAVLMDNAHEPIETFAAAMKAGFTHVPLNSRLTAGRDRGAVPRLRRRRPHRRPGPPARGREGPRRHARPAPSRDDRGR